MTLPSTYRLGLWTLISLATTACLGQSGDPYDTDVGTEWGVDTDVDTEWDVDTDVDTDSDSDADSDSDTDTDTEPECDLTAPVTVWISPDDSNSMSAAAQARDAVLYGTRSLASVPLRTYEFMNYYGFPYTPAEAGSLAIWPSIIPNPDSPDNQWLFQVGVASPERTHSMREPLNLTLVLDTSGSMETGDAIEHLKYSCTAIAGSLRAGDTVSIVTWSTSNAVVLDAHTVSGPNDPTLTSLIDGLTSGGGTDLHGGLSAGYAQAVSHFSTDRINRVVLISDGGANVGITDVDLIASYAAHTEVEGIYLVGVGVGSDATYNDTLMDEVTDAGRGASVFIGSEAEAERVFQRDFVRVMDVAARDVEIELELPAGFEIARTTAETVSTVRADVEPQNLAPNDAMVVFNTLEHCDPDALTSSETFTVTAHYRDALTFENRTVTSSMTLQQLLDSNDTALLKKGRAVEAYVEALRAFKEGVGATDAIGHALAVLDQADAARPDDADLAEIRQVILALLQ